MLSNGELEQFPGTPPCTNPFCETDAHKCLPLVIDDMYGRHYWDVPLSAITAKLMKVCMRL